MPSPVFGSGPGDPKAVCCVWVWPGHRAGAVPCVWWGCSAVGGGGAPAAAVGRGLGRGQGGAVRGWSWYTADAAHGRGF